MSIFGTTLAFDGEDHELPGCAAYVAEDGMEGCYVLSGKECDCPARYTSAIRYEGSHVYPDPENRGAEFDLGVIPGHIAEGGGYADDHEHWKIACHRPFLRVSFSDPYGGDYPSANRSPSQGTVILDAKQVEELRDNLTAFLERITGEWCLAAEPKEQRERDFAAFLETIKPVSP